MIRRVDWALVGWECLEDRHPEVVTELPVVAARHIHISFPEPCAGALVAPRVGGWRLQGLDGSVAELNLCHITCAVEKGLLAAESHSGTHRAFEANSDPSSYTSFQQVIRGSLLCILGLLIAAVNEDQCPCDIYIWTWICSGDEHESIAIRKDYLT